ncbi:MAG: UMP kinase [Rickettsiales bacterium]|jgi:uridylate kinase|nr:UMP kinase [Rickettsiales bacterium]
MVKPSDAKRILIKLSGESLMGIGEYGHDLETINRVCCEIKQVYESGKEICLVVGGGNIFRGVSAASKGMERASADYMGMLATVINALALQNTLETLGVSTRVMSAISMMQICETYVRRKAVRNMEKGRIVIFAAGTGNPFFTTDTAAALRAVEMGCDMLLKATSVDGVYDKDPNVHADAIRYDTISYSKVLADNLRVMDGSAISLARDNHLPIVVFSIKDQNEIVNVFEDKAKYTVITEGI